MEQYLNEIIELRKCTEDELLSLIGQDVRDLNQAFPPSVSTLIDIGRNWFNERKDEIAGVICNNSIIIGFEKHDDIVLISAIADLISGICSGISPFTVATLIVRRGIKSICSESEQEGN